jgi:transposase
MPHERSNTYPDQKVELEALHDASRDKRDCDRIKAVLLRSEGWSTKRIAQALRLHETSIVRHIDDYVQKEKLKPDNGGSVSCLSAEQKSLIIAHITAYTYCHAHQISEYIREACEVLFSISGHNKWLHQQGFSYKQP